MEFIEFPKMARLTRECIITEKIDGTNAQIGIDDTGTMLHAGSRTRWLSAEQDNFGFYAWAMAHRDELLTLGPGRHFGEWWGSGVQRGYGLSKGEKRFSLFNTSRWADDRDREKYPIDRPVCCHVVPVLYQGLFGPKFVNDMLAKLRAEGSMAAPGFMQPEGVVVYHVAAGVAFKKTLEKDEEPKSKHARPQPVLA